MSERSNNIKVCFFPGRESSYARTRVFLKGLQSIGLSVFDCSSPQKKIFRYLSGFFKFLKYKSKSDVILVGFLGQFLMPFVRLFTRKIIIYDAFISIYQTLAFDRKSIGEEGVYASLARWIDRYSANLADHVILDTNQHLHYYVKEYGLPKEKMSRVLVGSDDSIMHPQKTVSDTFTVHFHGEFQSLHGAEYIIEAAKILPHVHFQMIGKGKQKGVCLEKVKEWNIQNIKFIERVSYEHLSAHINQADVCLGIFGNTEKTQMVIPHKVYESLACQKPLITADTPAARELLTDGKNCLLIKAADPFALADAITKLKENATLKENIANGGYKLFTEKCTPDKIGEQLGEILHSYVYEK